MEHFYLFSSWKRDFDKDNALSYLFLCYACFKLLEKLMKDIHRMIPKFLWDLSEGEQKLYWAKWEILCKFKDNEGLGFQNFECFNFAC